MNTAINQLIQYGLQNELIHEDDIAYVANRLLDLFGLTEFEYEKGNGECVALVLVLETMLAKAIEQGKIENTTTEKDLFDTRIMDILTPRPHEVVRTFEAYEQEDAQKATDWYYALSVNTNYIRMDRIQKNIEFTTPSRYAPMRITINLSKPEKDPKEIAKAKQVASTNYPKCLLCKENVGFAGNASHPARQNHRVIPLDLKNGRYDLQYSPYVYYNEHCIVFNEQHVPMKIDRETFENLFAFVRRFPHYMAGSNTDIPIVGGSILSHDHYQGGRAHFPIEDAKSFANVTIDGCQGELLVWPLSTIRLHDTDPDKLVNASVHVLEAWKRYEDLSRDIVPYTGSERHNAITPIVRFRNGRYEVDLVLRNNRTSAQYPDGIFHPHPEHHHIKKENIGLIEVMGLAILPGRLKDELAEIERVLRKETTLENARGIEHHKPWVRELLTKPWKDDVHEALRQEVGHKFVQVLENAGVFKMDADGQAGMLQFIEFVQEN